MIALNGVETVLKTIEHFLETFYSFYILLSSDELCTLGVSFCLPNSKGDPPLWTALESEQDEIASVLVRHGVDTDCWSHGPDGCLQTLLHRAIDENKEAAAIFLIRSRCDLDSPRQPGPNGEGIFDTI